MRYRVDASQKSREGLVFASPSERRCGEPSAVKVSNCQRAATLRRTRTERTPISTSLIGCWWRQRKEGTAWQNRCEDGSDGERIYCQSRVDFECCRELRPRYLVTTTVSCFGNLVTMLHRAGWQMRQIRVPYDAVSQIRATFMLKERQVLGGFKER
jgi:hypothetical protein